MEVTQLLKRHTDQVVSKPLLLSKKEVHPGPYEVLLRRGTLSKVAVLVRTLTVEMF
jgi:hypothetical protein